MADRRKLPPLNAVRAFEAAFRHQGFAAAADELAVTPSAVSQQVKGLEDWLGIALFERQARGLVPTRAARNYAPGLTDILDRLEDLTQAVRPKPSDRTLTITSLSSFAANWLAPRLGQFSDAHPEIDMRLASGDRLVDFAAEGVDAGVRHGTGNYPGLNVELLMREVLTPVCSPNLMHGPHPLRTLDDLQHHALLHDQDAWVNSLARWDSWLREAGRPDLACDRGPGFSDSHLIVQAAIAGRGVMLGRSALVGDALMSGALVAPFDIRLLSDAAYWFVTPSSPLSPNVQTFRDWIFSETARFLEECPLTLEPTA